MPQAAPTFETTPPASAGTAWFRRYMNAVAAYVEWTQCWFPEMTRAELDAKAAEIDRNIAADPRLSP